MELTVTEIALWIDDERPTPEGYSHTAKNSAEAITLLEQSMLDGTITLKLVSFDHDLGQPWIEQDNIANDTTRPILTWMIENDYWPEEIRIHTANPVGSQWLEGTAKRYAPETVTLPNYYPHVQRGRN